MWSICCIFFIFFVFSNLCIIIKSMKNLLECIKNGVIVSCQAQENEPFHNEIAISAMMSDVVSGGACALRVAGARDVSLAKKMFPDIPVIGITKPKIIPQNYKELVYITPTLEDAKTLAEAGADIIAFDATKRKREVSVCDMINKIHSLGKLAMADIALFDEALEAEKCSADLISTTLSGYTTQSDNNSEKPDFELLEKSVQNLKTPIILEGRIWEPDDIKKAFELQAHSVVIGSAITRPKEIVKRFIRKAKV